MQKEVMLRTSFKKPIFDLQTPTVTLTFEVRTWVIHATHRLIVVNNCAKLFEIQSMHKGVMLCTSFKKSNSDLQTPTVTLTFEVWTWVMHTTHCLIVINNWAKLFENQSIHLGVMLCTSFNKPIFDLQTPTVTLTFEVRTWLMHATHRLIVMNNCAKFFENQSMHKGDMLCTSFKKPILTFKLQLWPWPLRYGPGVDISKVSPYRKMWWTLRRR